MILTKHGKQRIKERLGLPKRAHIKHLKRVFKDGSVYLKRGYRELKVVYNGFLYIFSFTDKKEPIFITTFKEKEFYLVG
jgi:hypothetical protein